ncbi:MULTISPECIES: signal peptide peptidase SppA [unclassified Sphingomonas]|uniref:signal peptide peptidase SppA n=1 Tax=Sphingomonas TaxID=13687 RepID=UPI00096508BF|nr:MULTISPECIES: signal peptide peptidase SppA [unclassified Sphingomonas]MBN8810548.1 signal peptide peptidase SppA [Sphingomonas sp.]OJY51063.1 MAG: signal peptide peptidase SppA [Sphingomonas sp. 67-41]
MKLVRGAWKILVGIKDFLVLVFMLLFFTMLFAALSAKPNPGSIRDGALLVALDGALVEQPEEADPFSRLSGAGTVKQQRLRDVVRALDAAKGDDHVKAVVLDLDRFTGGYPAAISEVAAAVGKVRAAGKPVLAYATAYTDDSYALAANASEIWVNPLGGAMFAGPGGTRLYYKGLIDKLGVNAHIYRVGKFKSAVEPYMRSDMSPEAKEADLAMYQQILDQWRQEIAKARPKARIADYLAKPAETVTAAKGDIAKANLAMGIVDKLGDRLAFGKRVAEIAGAPSGKPAGNFNRIKLADFVAAHPLPTGGDAIGVITVAGEIVDGKGGPGRAAGDTVSAALLKGLANKKLKALVVRVDSPGGSALASEQIRQAILQAKAQGLPVVISMGSLAASGGYWVSTAGDTIFAEPNTITGSIGIFGVIPTFEKTLAKIGVGTDGVKTTPLSGQPDIYGGTNAETDTLLQSAIEAGYARFVGLVAGARKLTPERVNEIAQGRVWIGGTAHQIGLVDRFGGIDDAIAEAARRAKLDPAKVHAVYLEKEPSSWAKLIASFADDKDEDGDWADQPAGADLFARAAIGQRALLAQALGDARRLATGGSVQARCLECGGFGPATGSLEDARLFDAIAARLGL